MTLQEFAGLTAVVDSFKDSDKKLMVATIDKLVAAYHAYLRKFDAGSPAASDVSVPSSAASSQKWVPKRKKLVEVPVALRARVSSPSLVGATRVPSPTVQSGGESGYCYLDAIRDEWVAETKRALGSYPTFTQLLSLPIQNYDLRSGLRVSFTSGGMAHVGAVGTDQFESVMSAVAKTEDAVYEPHSARAYFSGLSRGVNRIVDPATRVGTSGKTSELSRWTLDTGDPRGLVAMESGESHVLPRDTKFVCYTRARLEKVNADGFCQFISKWRDHYGWSAPLILHYKAGVVVEVIAGDARPGPDFISEG
jgi:hypothetical protein